MDTSPKKILFLTNSDYGLCNVILATAHALLLAAPQNVEIHIASFDPLEATVGKVSDFALEGLKGSTRTPLIFHAIRGVSWGEASFRPETGPMLAQSLPPTLRNVIKCVFTMPQMMLPWSLKEFSAIYGEVGRVLGEVQPDLTIVEPLFTPGLTLCQRMQTKWMVLSPNTIKDFALPLQPRLAMMWKYPLICSALPFPVPWSLIPLNIFLNLVGAYGVLTNNVVQNATKHIRKKTGDPSITVMTAMELGVIKAAPPGLRILVANSPDIDYPFSALPAHVTPCGPIMRATPTIRDIDLPLANWLARGPTVYVSLGTQLKAEPEEALEMARACRTVLEHVSGKWGKTLQILWKLGRKPEIGAAPLETDVYEGAWKDVVNVLQGYGDRVRITNWVVAEPKSVLESGHVVCLVNHGGASSFHEALCAGVPQVLLPPWADCYDFANRAELLGIGRWANKHAKPRWKENELASALEAVLFGPDAYKIRAKANDLASRHPEYAGREKAAKEILAILEK